MPAPPKTSSLTPGVTGVSGKDRRKGAPASSEPKTGLGTDDGRIAGYHSGKRKGSSSKVETVEVFWCKGEFTLEATNQINLGRLAVVLVG